MQTISPEIEEVKQPKFELTLKGVAKAINEGLCKNIIVITGAGISVAAGIPDFRTPGTGLYDTIAQSEGIFDIQY